MKLKCQICSFCKHFEYSQWNDLKKNRSTYISYEFKAILCIFTVWYMKSIGCGCLSMR